MSLEQMASSIVVAATFFLLPTLGEIITERSGVLNLGVEGMMISGAAGSFAVTYATGSVWLGMIAGMLIGGILAFIHAVVTITFNRNQVVSGISLTIFGTGLSGLLGLGLAGLQILPLQPIIIPSLSTIPFIGPVFFSKNFLVYLSFILVPVLWFFLFKTRYGIIIRTVGENPMAAYTQGIDVIRVRYLCVIFGGMMCGLGGAYLTLGWIPLWIEGMTAAKGWIVIALAVVGLWHPVGVLFGAYIFGAFEVLQFTFQPLGVPAPFLNMLPSLTTILFLVIWGILLNVSKVKRIIGAPTALCVPFEKPQ
jgi:simple sugar transport system permease protein